MPKKVTSILAIDPELVDNFARVRMGPLRPPGCSRRAGGDSPILRLGSEGKGEARCPDILPIGNPLRITSESPPARLLHPGGRKDQKHRAKRTLAETPVTNEGEPMTPKNTTPMLTPETSRRQGGPASARESTARSALEALLGTKLPDPEWDRMRARLLEYVSILRTWRQALTTGESALPTAA